MPYNPLQGSIFDVKQKQNEVTGKATEFMLNQVDPLLQTIKFVGAASNVVGAGVQSQFLHMQGNQLQSQVSMFNGLSALKAGGVDISGITTLAGLQSKLEANAPTTQDAAYKDMMTNIKSLKGTASETDGNSYVTGLTSAPVGPGLTGSDGLATGGTALNGRISDFKTNVTTFSTAVSGLDTALQTTNKDFFNSYNRAMKQHGDLMTTIAYTTAAISTVQKAALTTILSPVMGGPVGASAAASAIVDTMVSQVQGQEPDFGKIATNAGVSAATAYVIPQVLKDSGITSQAGGITVGAVTGAVTGYGLTLATGGSAQDAKNAAIMGAVTGGMAGSSGATDNANAQAAAAATTAQQTRITSAKGGDTSGLQAGDSFTTTDAQGNNPVKMTKNVDGSITGTRADGSTFNTGTGNGGQPGNLFNSDGTYNNDTIASLTQPIGTGSTSGDNTSGISGGNSNLDPVTGLPRVNVLPASKGPVVVTPTAGGGIDPTTGLPTVTKQPDNNTLVNTGGDPGVGGNPSIVKPPVVTNPSGSATAGMSIANLMSTPGGIASLITTLTTALTGGLNSPTGTLPSSAASTYTPGAAAGTYTAPTPTANTNTTGTTVGSSDPFAQYRAGYGKQLNDLMQNPNSVTDLPGYKFMQDQGNQSTARAMAAKGYSASGNEMLALQDQNQKLAYQMYNDQYTKLNNLSGADNATVAQYAQVDTTRAQNLASNKITSDQYAATNAQAAANLNSQNTQYAETNKYNSAYLASQARAQDIAAQQVQATTYSANVGAVGNVLGQFITGTPTPTAAPVAAPSK
jgi:hypothetical protein